MDFKQDSQELLKMSDWIDTNSVQTIVLETTNENLISYIFDKNGKYIRKIGPPGRGGGEYLNIANIDVDESKKEVILFDSEYCRIFIYNCNGDFIRGHFQ